MKDFYKTSRKTWSRRIGRVRERIDTSPALDALDRKYLSRVRLRQELPPAYTIGMVVLAHERPDYLERCLDSLFSTNLHTYDLTILIMDDGSKDPRVREIISRGRDRKYRVIREFCPKGPNSWGAAFNRAIRSLLDTGRFDIVGSCDADAFFHPEWLRKMLEICTWAKEHESRHILGPFSCFNSSNYGYHRIIGTYPTPYGNYVVKRGMGALTYFYYTDDLLNLGFFDEDENDEFMMTKKFASQRIRNFCTETSYVEHMGRKSVLDQWRPLPVEWGGIDYGMNLEKEGWPYGIEEVDTLGYYRFIRGNVTSKEGVSSRVPLDVVIPAVEKDCAVLPHAVEGVRRWLRHPVKSISIISPESETIRAICESTGCTFVNEETVVPFTTDDLRYFVNGVDRSGWVFQQFLKYSLDAVCSEEHILVLDADTVLLRPQVFEVNGRIVFLHSDEHHQPYFNLYRQLFGSETPTNLSFVSHQVILRQSRIRELRNEIRTRHGNEEWFRAIMNLVTSSPEFAMSEYEIYGQWMLRNYPGEMAREYWFNIPCRPKNLKAVLADADRLAREYRSVSFHSYLV